MVITTDMNRTTDRCGRIANRLPAEYRKYLNILVQILEKMRARELAYFYDPLEVACINNSPSDESL
jgi:hypothetical protein